MRQDLQETHALLNSQQEPGRSLGHLKWQRLGTGSCPETLKFHFTKDYRKDNIPSLGIATMGKKLHDCQLKQFKVLFEVYSFEVLGAGIAVESFLTLEVNVTLS